MKLYDVTIQCRAGRRRRLTKIFSANDAEQARANAVASVAMFSPAFEVVRVKPVPDAALRAVLAMLEMVLARRRAATLTCDSRGRRIASHEGPNTP